MFWRRLRKIVQRTLFLPAQADRDLDDEIRHHLAEEARLGSERGLSELDAAAAAHRAFGNVALTKERTRAVWVSTAAEQLLQDLRLGARILTRSPGISATAVILVALVIGGNTTVFSIAHGILTKPASGVHAAGLVTFSWINDAGDVETHTPYRVYSRFLEHSRTLDSVAAFDFQRVTLTHANGSYAVRVGIVSPNYFDTLGVRVVKGRSFTAAEASRGTSGLVIVVAHTLWQNSLQGNEGVVGQSVTLNGQPATIIGVAEPAFRGAWLAEMADVWVPLVGEFREWLQPNRSSVDVAMFGRRAPGVSLAEAQAELTTLWTSLRRGDPGLNQQVKVRLVPYSMTGGGNSIIAMQGNRMLAIFSVVTLLTIAIVCANVANLLIARAVVRQREVALRQSLGASRARIIRSLLAEGLALSIVAWIAACLFAWFVSKAVVTWLMSSAPAGMTMPDLTPDWTVVGYALVLAILCTVTVTLGPALLTWRQQLLPFLKIGEQGVVPARSRLSRILVVLQLAFSVLLLTSAGLVHRSLSLEESLDVGFDTRNLLLVTVNTAGGADGPKTNAALIEVLKARLAGLPGVDGITSLPGGRGRLSNWSDFPVRRDQAAHPIIAVNSRVAPEYFTVLGVPFVEGHDFVPDAVRTRPSAIISRDLAETLWPGESALGKTLLAGPLDAAVEAEVVGVVRDAFFSGRASQARPRYIFFASSERPSPPGDTTFCIRRSGSQEAIAPAIARALRDADARVAIAAVRSLEHDIAADAAPVWMLTTLLTLFAVGSLLIAAIGQYAVVTFDGRRRSREFGLRIALGASSQQLLASVMTESFRLTALGLAIGFALSVGVGKVMVRILYGVTPTDAPTYLGVFLLLGVASLLACYLPARRASRTDPMLVLRTE
jgi:predicted permease